MNILIVIKLDFSSFTTSYTITQCHFQIKYLNFFLLFLVEKFSYSKYNEHFRACVILKNIPATSLTSDEVRLKL